MQYRGIEVHLVPAQVTGLDSAQSVAENQEDHGGVRCPWRLALAPSIRASTSPGVQVLRFRISHSDAWSRHCSIYFGRATTLR